MARNRQAGCLHLIAGGTGAGKTTYAKALASREHALLLSIDDWMGRLFWPDTKATTPEDLGTWAHERAARCTAQMREALGQTLPLGLSAVADAGFTTRADRAAFSDWAAALGLPVRLHWVDVEAGTRWQRVEARNAAGGGGTGFVVTAEMFAYMEGLWEAPEAAEMAALDGIRVDASGNAVSPEKAVSGIVEGRGGFGHG
ncbi:MAG: ATP-binding protein [Pseudomonadota bacterium]